MSFASPAFLFVFFPIFFLLYFAAPRMLGNLLIFAASSLFYFIGAGSLYLILLASVIGNHLLAQALGKIHDEPRRKVVMWAGVLFNLAPLICFKYLPSAVLPAGISFFTFQGISYIVDIYRRETAPAEALDFAMYHTLFPQLIAGPIVRFREIAAQIRQRPATAEDIQTGICRFCVGLGKKIILADSAGAIADRMFSLPQDHLSAGAAWLGLAAYSVQILFDFSGYSDMAIGMGRMLGFRFPENFDQPYRARSITEFWRRWHMTLSRWFRDYLYIPLGGNRAGPLRTYTNLVIVFALCGLWHGAALTFLIWGLWHGLWLILERVARTRWRREPSGPAGWAATLLLVMIGWVFFRAPTLTAAIQFLSAMAGFGGKTAPADLAVASADKIFFLITGAALALLPPPTFFSAPARTVRGAAFALLLLFYSSSIIGANGFNPFIYFRF